MKMTLILNVEKNNLEQVKHLLTQNISINDLNHSEQSALYIACEKGHSEIARILLEHGALVNHGNNPLLAASKNGHESCVRLLLKFKADVHVTNSQRRSAMDLAGCGKHFSIMELLFDNGAKPGDDDSWMKHVSLQQTRFVTKLCRQEQQWCPKSWFFKGLHCAFKIGIRDLALQILSESRPCADQQYFFALYYSAKHNWPDILEHLLDEGVEVNYVNNVGMNELSRTALYSACEQGHTNIVQLLLQRGADANVVSRTNDAYSLPVQIAAVNGDVEILQLLVHHGAELDSNKLKRNGLRDSTSPLHLAFDKSHFEIVQLLVDKGINVNIADAKGQTVLHKAAQSCCLEHVQKLLSLGASVKSVNIKNESVLHLALTPADTHKDDVGENENLAPDACPLGFFDSHVIAAANALATNKCAKSETEIAAVVDILLQHGADCNVIGCDGETALYRACERKLSSVVKLLLEAGSDANLMRSNKYPLIIACQTGYKEIVKQLLAAGAVINIIPHSSDSMVQRSALLRLAQSQLMPGSRSLRRNGANAPLLAPLCVAVKNCTPDIIEVLLLNGADVNLCDELGERAIDYAILELIKSKGTDRYKDCRTVLCTLLDANADVGTKTANSLSSPLYKVCSEGMLDIAEDLLRHGASQTLNFQSDMFNSLAVACQNNREDTVRLLLTHGAKPMNPTPISGGQVGHNQQLVLNTAAANGNIKIVKMLIKSGASVNQADRNGSTALHYACNAAVADILIQNNANVNTLNSNNETPLFQACTKQRLCVVSSLLKNGANPNLCSRAVPLIAACNANHFPIVCLLLARGADPNQVSTVKGVSALCISCRNNCVEIVEQLLSKGAQLDVVDANGNSPLHSAISGKYYAVDSSSSLAVVKMLLAKNAAVNVLNKFDESPLGLAVRYNAESIVQLLLDHGAEVDLNPPFCKSPLICACRNGSVAIVKLLLDHSADTEVRDDDAASSSPLLIAVDELHDGIVKLLLDDDNVDISDENADTPLHRALKVNTCPYERDDDSMTLAKQIRMISLLLDSRPDVNVFNKLGETPLLLACKIDHDRDKELVKLLLFNDADPNLRPAKKPNNCAAAKSSSRRYNFMYPLSYAVSCCNETLVELLLDSGALCDNVESDGSTALHRAIENIKLRSCAGSDTKIHDISIITMLLDAGASVDLADAVGETALYKACKRNIVSLVSLLLERGANPNQCVGNKCPLIAACQVDNVVIITMLLSRGADTGCHVTGGEHLPRNESNAPLCIAAMKRNVMAIEILLKHGADVNQQDGEGKTALHKLSDSSHATASECIRLLLDSKADVSKLCKNMESPLYMASKAGLVETVKSMLTKCSFPLAYQQVAKQPLAAACIYNRFEIVKLLVENGADVNEISLPPIGSSVELPLGIAAARGQLDIVRYLLDHGADVNSTAAFQTALHCVVDMMHDFPKDIALRRTGQCAVFDMLLERGADVNITSGNDRSTAIYKATAKRLCHAVDELLKFGGNPDVESSSGTPLYLACRNDDVKTVEVLLTGGADPNIHSSSDRVPLLRAAETLNGGIVNLLLMSGAKVDSFENVLTEKEIRGDELLALKDFLIAFRKFDKCLIQLFKAGYMLKLLSTSCRLQRCRFPFDTQSIRLCQAVVLAGYHVKSSDLESLGGHANDCQRQLQTWLEEDMKQAPSLMRQCRIVIRKQLLIGSNYQSIIPLVDSLPIPDQLQMYIKFEGYLNEVDLNVSQTESGMDDVDSEYEGDDVDDDDDDDEGDYVDDDEDDDDEDYYGYEDDECLYRDGSSDCEDFDNPFFSYLLAGSCCLSSACESHDYDYD